MNKLSVSRRYSSMIAPVLTLAILLTSCSKASERQEAKNAPHTAPPGWQTICLDRFLIDLPASVQMGSTDAKYQDAYGFDGIHDIGGKGLSWGKVTVGETVPTTVHGYRNIYNGADARIASAEKYAAGFEALEETIRYQTKRAQSGTAGEIAAMKKMVADSKRDLKDSHYGLKVTGKAKLPEKQAFAFRRGDEYSVGYLDATDQRMRVFEGAITQRQLESPEAAAFEYRRFQRIYHRRVPTDIPTTPGFCTAHGFIDEAARPELDTTLELPFRSLKYPNLFFRLTVAPAYPNGKRNIQKLPKMDADRANLHEVGIKGDYGPVAENILGTPGRSYGHEYGLNCSATSCRPADQAYEIEAETFGELGRPGQPHLILHMIAATSDDYRLKLPAEPRDPSYNKPGRPALSGHVPPPFDEGKKIFEQVLRSIRLRPGAIATPNAVAPEVSAAQPATKK
jgi:hypothetical protein